MRIGSASARERWLCSQAGIHEPIVLLMRLGENTLKTLEQAQHRTIHVAHKFIQENWYKMNPGDVVDVGFISEETSEPVASLFDSDAPLQPHHRAVAEKVAEEFNAAFFGDDYGVLLEDRKIGMPAEAEGTFPDGTVRSAQVAIDKPWWDYCNSFPSFRALRRDHGATTP